MSVTDSGCLQGDSEPQQKEHERWLSFNAAFNADFNQTFLSRWHDGSGTNFLAPYKAYHIVLSTFLAIASMILIEPREAKKKPSMNEHERGHGRLLKRRHTLKLGNMV
jgi:putative Ca2+/H+ antiporter (TMEM165/GDT1 family)